ncbi:MAG TPA: type I-U CRISPR-associated RAMP protein Csb1/Cas7u [Gaiellaceae bacterium]|nr:type I-U CRISPR-associated RAMP protein Csb1/Cas7u [Gaiellaceae bacterium]
MELDLALLTDAVDDRGTSDLAAIRFRQEYEPAAGRGAKVYPPTYPRNNAPPYIFERRFDDAGEPVETVLLDSVASQANRVEEALLDAVDDQLVRIPLLIVETTIHGRPIRLTSLQMPHRCSDAYLRDSETADGTRFDATEIGRALRRATLRDAEIVYRVCPTALVYGTWDSYRGRPELSFKAPRVWVSELYGVLRDRESDVGLRPGSRLDPIGMLGATVKKIGEEQSEWEFVEPGEDEPVPAREPKWTKVKLGATTRISTIGHGNIRPEVNVGGVAIERARRTASLSLAGLRRLRFPVGGERSPKRDAAGRATLVALALLGDRLAFGRPDLSLRSGCDLVVVEDAVEMVDRGGKATAIDLTAKRAQQLLEEAMGRAETLGLKWLTEPVVLRPRPNLQRALEASLPEI